MEKKDVFVSKPTFYQRLNLFRVLLVLVIMATAILTVLVKQFDYFKTDLFVTRSIQGLNPFWFDSLMRFLSWLGDLWMGSLVILVVSVILLLLGKRKSVLMFLVSSYGAISLSELIKFIIGRPRPDSTLINQIGKFTRSDSFPSGHVMFAVGLYGFLLFLVFTQLKSRLVLKKILLITLAVPVFLMGLSRIYLGAHWFSDVIGAYLFGYIWLFIMVNIYKSLDPQVNPK